MMSDLEYFQALLESSPKSTKYLPLALIYSRLGKYEEVVNVAQDGLKLYPEFTHLQVLLADAYVQTGRKDMAIEILYEVVAHDMDNYYALKLLGNIFKSYSKDEEALRYLKAAYIKSPEDKELFTAIEELGGFSELMSTQEDPISVADAEQLPNNADEFTGMACKLMDGADKAIGDLMRDVDAYQQAGKSANDMFATAAKASINPPMSDVQAAVTAQAEPKHADLNLDINMGAIEDADNALDDAILSELLPDINSDNDDTGGDDVNGYPDDQYQSRVNASLSLGAGDAPILNAKELSDEEIIYSIAMANKPDKGLTEYTEFDDVANDSHDDISALADALEASTNTADDNAATAEQFADVAEHEEDIDDDLGLEGALDLLLRAVSADEEADSIDTIDTKEDLFERTPEFNKNATDSSVFLGASIENSIDGADSPAPQQEIEEFSAIDISANDEKEAHISSDTDIEIGEEPNDETGDETVYVQPSVHFDLGDDDDLRRAMLAAEAKIPEPDTDKNIQSFTLPNDAPEQAESDLERAEQQAIQNMITMPDLGMEIKDLKESKYSDVKNAEGVTDEEMQSILSSIAVTFANEDNVALVEMDEPLEQPNQKHTEDELSSYIAANMQKFEDAEPIYSETRYDHVTKEQDELGNVISSMAYIPDIPDEKVIQDKAILAEVEDDSDDIIDNAEGKLAPIVPDDLLEKVYMEGGVSRDDAFDEDDRISVDDIAAQKVLSGASGDNDEE